MKYWKFTQVVLVIISVLSICLVMGLSSYFHDTRPVTPDPTNHRIYAHAVKGRVVYLTELENSSFPILYTIFGLGFIVAARIDKSKSK